MKMFRFLPLMVGLAIPHLGVAAAPEGSLDIATFGAKGEGELDSRDAIQKAIDAAKESGAPVYIPAGRYIVNGDLWLPSKAHLVGEGAESVLEFSDGQLRSEKYGRRDFGYSFNYNNEQLYGGSAISLAADAEAKSDELTLAEEHQFAPGDVITIFNNALDTWTILEDKNQSEAWNGTGSVLYARGQIVEVAEVNGKIVKLKEPLETPMPAGARVEKHGGAKDVVVEKLKLVKRTAKGGRPKYVIHFEQPFRTRLSELVIEGAPEGVGGGIGLSYWVYQCVVDKCTITTTKWRGITIENFGTGNEISNNKLTYTHGGDCALILLLDIRNTKIFGNSIHADGVALNNEGGIYVHALSINNKVYDNEVIGASEAYGVFYGASSNLFENNRASEGRNGIVSWYSNSNEFRKNKISIKSDRPGPKVGVYIGGSKDIVLQNNQVTGPIQKVLLTEGVNSGIKMDGKLEGQK